MIWTDGSIYEGEWLNGIQNGFGKMTFPNGKSKEGIFEKNIFKGFQAPPTCFDKFSMKPIKSNKSRTLK